LDLASATDEQILKSLQNVVSHRVTVVRRVETKLFRVRKGDNPLSTQDDLWCRQQQEPQRVNPAGKRVLYVADSWATAVIEAQVKIGEEFNLITYGIKSDEEFLVADWIDHDSIDKNFTGDDWTYLKILRNFLDGEFLRHVGEANEFQYRSPQALCWNFLNQVRVDPQNHSTVTDGFLYASVARYRRGWNLAVKADADLGQDKAGTDKLVAEIVQRCVRTQPPVDHEVSIFPYMETRHTKGEKLNYEIDGSRPEGGTT